MYNGIGLQTARGSGTNGYVQRNLSFINKQKQKINYKTEEDIKRLDDSLNRPPNQEILAHQRKRQIELKCLELRIKLEEQGVDDEEIEKKVEVYRDQLKLKAEEALRRREEFLAEGNLNVKETHRMAEINQERNSNLKNALGISKFFVEGSSLDPNRKAKEELAKAESLASKEYPILEEPPLTEKEIARGEIGPKPDKIKIKDEKANKKRSHSSSSSSDSDSDSDSDSESESSSSSSDDNSSDSTPVKLQKKDKLNRDDRSERKKGVSKTHRSHKRRSRSSSSSSSSPSSSSSDSDSSSGSSDESSLSSSDSDSETASRRKSKAKHPKKTHSSNNNKSKKRKYSSSSKSDSSDGSRKRRRRSSPSFRDRRRITSARKKPVPYKRTPLSSCSSPSDSASYNGTFQRPFLQNLRDNRPFK